MEDTWVDHLLGVLVAVLQWLQPLLTPNNYDALVASLLLKASCALHGHERHHRWAYTTACRDLAIVLMC